MFLERESIEFMEKVVQRMELSLEWFVLSGSHDTVYISKAVIVFDSLHVHFPSLIR